MRLIDADAFCAFCREVSTRQHYETLLTNKDKFPTVADVIEAICCDLDGTGLDGFNNAPTVPQVTVFTENADEKAVTDLKAELQSVIEPRPQGEWIFDSEHTEFGNPYGTYKCNKCGGHSSNKYPFCFWCGAKMKGGVA